MHHLISKPSRLLSTLPLTLMALGLAASAAVADTRDADEIFDRYCFSCHGTGWDNAPVIGDSFAWEERRAKGLETLMKNTMEGFNTMPPKGSCSDCSEAELQSVVEMLIAE